MAKTSQHAALSIWRLAPINPLEPPFYLALVPSSVIVAAESEEAARRIASGAAGPHDAEAWLDEGLSSCEVLAAEEPGVIARDFSPAPPAPPPAITAPPALVDVPYLDGSGVVGTSLECTMGNWNNMDVEPHSYAYGWQRDGVGVGSGPANTYDVTADDAGHSITCVVTATNDAGDTTAPPSNAVAVESGASRRR